MEILATRRKHEEYLNGWDVRAAANVIGPYISWFICERFYPMLAYDMLEPMGHG